MADPRVGDVVHYIDLQEVCKAAIVTQINGDGTINVTAFGPTGGVASLSTVVHEETLRPDNSWHWPEVA